MTQLDEPVALTAPTLGRVRNVDAALARHGERVNQYVLALRMGDPLADAFAIDCQKIGKGRGLQMLDEAISTGVVPDDAPDSLRALMAQVEEVPFWADMEQIDLGAAAYSRHAREAGIALGTASLVSGYSNAAATAPLAVTMRFRDQAKLRALETSMWVFATARPGGLHRDGVGFARTVRVRMIHAFVRRHILEHIEWDVDDLGIPINQADLAFTVVEFSMLPIRAMQRLGVHFNAAEIAGMYAMWRYMGYLIGVEDQVLTTNQAEAERLEDLQHIVAPPPDQYCRDFVTALLDDVLAMDLENASGLLGIVGRRNGRQLLHGLARNFVGDEIADGLGIEDTRWKHVPFLTKPVMGISSRITARVPALQERQMRKNLAEVDFVLSETAESLGVSHDLVDQAAGHPSSR